MHTDVTIETNNQADDNPAAEATPVVVDLGGVVDSETSASPEARLAEIVRIFDKAHMPYFERADLALEYYKITARLTGQDVQNDSPGGRLRIMSQMARELALPGETVDAKRKWLERALAIAGICMEARAAAIEKRLARHQSALLEIAQADDEEGQLKKVNDIASDRRARRHRRSPGPKSLNAIIRYPADRKDQVLAALAAFAEQHEVSCYRDVHKRIFTQ
jgi:hypothetical protein